VDVLYSPVVGVVKALGEMLLQIGLEVLLCLFTLRGQNNTIPGAL
jgi:hypothetical protein